MSQKIKYVSIKNYKGIEDIQTEIPSRFVAIFGQNGAGKTSFLDAIKSAIKLERGGNSKVKVGSDSGEIIIEFDEFKIKRVIGDKSRLEVIYKGVSIAKPQSRLDEVFKGSIGDPHKLLSLPNRDKVRYILATHGKEEEFNKHEKERVVLFESRTEKHRTLNAKREEIKDTDVSKFEDIDKSEDIKIDELQKELEEGLKHNQKKTDLENRITNGNELISAKNIELNNAGDEIDRVDKEIIELKERRAQLLQNQTRISLDVSVFKEKRTALQSELDAFKIKDIEEIQITINDYHSNISKVADLKARKSIYDNQVKACTEVEDEWRELDNQVKEIEGKQNKLIESIKLAYKLKIESGKMFVLDGKDWIELSQLNKAKQLEIGIDICLGGPNEVKIITIEDANALDPNTLKKIKEKIESYDAQCFLETVYNTGYESIIIEDGKLPK